MALVALATSGVAAPIDAGPGVRVGRHRARPARRAARPGRRGDAGRASTSRWTRSPSPGATPCKHHVARGLLRAARRGSTTLDPSLRGRIDLVVSNPPYVGADELAALDPVLRHEPRGALVAEDTQAAIGFADLEVIIAEAGRWLTEDGVLICEHGDMQREAVLRAAEAAGFDVVVDLDDLAGRPRILVARR